MELYVLVLSMWGKTELDQWLYIGNQYVYNTPMQKEQCEQLKIDTSWSKHITNEYYRIQFDCMPESAEMKDKKDG